MPDYNKIAAGFALGAASPVTSGIEDVIYIFNESDFTISYNSANPLLVDSLTPVTASNKLYKFEGTNNSFNAVSKMAKTAVGPRYTEEVDFNLAGNSTDIKKQIQAMGYGRVKAIIVNNYKSGDSTVELFGAANGLIMSEAERNASDEGMEGGYKLKLTNPDKLREPYPPRAVMLSPDPGGVPSPTNTLIALENLAK
jgi:hypothetical protein